MWAPKTVLILERRNETILHLDVLSDFHLVKLLYSLIPDGQPHLPGVVFHQTLDQHMGDTIARLNLPGILKTHQFHSDVHVLHARPEVVQLHRLLSLTVQVLVGRKE